MKPIYLPNAIQFDLNVDQCSAIEKNIKNAHPKHAPIRIPPPILSSDLKQQLISDSIFITDMIFSVVDKIFSGDHYALARALKIDNILDEFIEELSKPEWIARAKKFYRPDFLLTTSGLRMVENNIDTPLGGIAVCDELIKKFQTGGNISNQKLKKLGLYSLSITTIWIDTIKKLLKQKKIINNRLPVFYFAYHSNNVCLEDDFSEQYYKNYITQSGFQFLRGPVGALTFESNKVMYQGTEIDVMYTDYGFTEFIENNQPFGIVTALINADKRGEVLFLSPPISMLFDNKAILAFLTDDSYSQYFTTEEWSRLKKLIPATRVVTAELREFCMQNKDQVVIKPAFGFGGQDVFPGFSLADETWNTIVNNAIHSSFPTVVQDIVTDQVKLYDEVQNEYVSFCLGPFFFDGLFAGCLYREATNLSIKNPIINITCGAKLSAVYFSID